jgi:fatty-acyl-CoA synthase
VIPTVAGPGFDAREEAGFSYVRGTDRVTLSDNTVGDVLIENALTYPDHRALAWLTPTDLASMTWGELYTGSRSAADVLAAINPEKKRVAFVAPNSTDWIIAMFGCALMGMAVVPTDPRATESEAEHIFTLADVGVVLVSDTDGGDVMSRMTVVAEKIANHPAVRPISGWRQSGPAGTQPSACVPCGAEFLVQHTSGTTGLPKAASLSHGAALNCARFFADGAGARQGDTWFNPLPLHHVGGSISGILAALVVAGTYVVAERFSPELALRVVREAQPGIVGLVPTMLIDLLAMPEVHESDFVSVRTVIGGATAVHPGLIEDVERRLGITFLVGCGQSEAPCMSMSSVRDGVLVRTRTLGRPLAGRDYYIANNAGAAAPRNSVGELCVRGPLTMSGYLRADGSVDDVTDDFGWRQTGDLCSLDVDGVLTFHGRSREVIIRGGTNIYPAEVEQALSGHDSIAEVAAFGVPDARLGERMVAAVITVGGGVVSLADLSRYAAARLSSQKRPTEWIVVSEFPRTSTGKVRKHALRQWYEDGNYTFVQDGPQVVKGLSRSERSDSTGT